MDEVIKLKDQEIVKLLAENRQLNEELRQCQNDKDFVWSLWKRLQVSSPDLTQAISVVMQREKEKGEIKDRKVLEILQTKDEQITNLQQSVDTLKEEHEKLIQMNKSLEDTRASLTDENDELKQRNDSVTKQLHTLQNSSNQNHFELKRRNNELVLENEELSTKYSKCNNDLTNTTSDLETTKLRLAQMKSKFSVSEEEIEDLKKKCDGLKEERETLSDEVIKLRTNIVGLSKSCETCKKTTNSCNVLKIQIEQQKSVIKQLQELNSDSQKVLNEQEQSHNDEAKKLKKMFSSLGKKYEALRNQHDNLKKSYTLLQEKFDIQDLPLHDTFTSEVEDLKIQVETQEDEINMLRDQLRWGRKDKQRPDSPNDFTFSPIIEKKHKRHRSYSPSDNRQQNTLKKRLLVCENKLEQTKNLLQLKKEELSTIMSAHNRRLERLKMLQQNYRSIKDKKTHARAGSMRQENSDKVWNELEKIKRENRNLMQKRITLEEELDVCRVQAAMDRATAQELRICLEQEKQELDTKLRKSAPTQRSSTPKKSGDSLDGKPLTTLKQLVTNLQKKNEKIEQEIRMKKQEANQMNKEIKMYKDEVKMLKQDVTDSRTTCSELRRETGMLRENYRKVEGERARLDMQLQLLDKENIDNTRAHDVLQDENIQLRKENASLRREISDMRNELQDIENTFKSNAPTRNVANDQASDFSEVDSDRRYYENNASETDDVESLGQDIVRSSRTNVAKKKHLNMRSTKDELVSLRLRFTALQKQCEVYKKQQNDNKQSTHDQEQKISMLENQLKNQQNKLKTANQNIQKLHVELDTISREKDELTNGIERMKTSLPDPQKYSDSDYKILESKNKSLQQELITTNSKVKQLEKDLDDKIENINSLKEKISRLERDVSMKRQLIEEQRSKVKTAEQNAKSDQETMSDLEERLQTCMDELQHKKSYVDSLKRQVQMMTREKSKYEEMFNKTREEADKKAQLLLKEQSARNDLEKTAKNLEENIEFQLGEIAARSEHALEKMREELMHSKERNDEFASFVQLLSNEVVDLTNQLQSSIEHHTQVVDKQARSSDSPSMTRAKSLACSILNMSQADFDDLMTPVDGTKPHMVESKVKDEHSAWKQRVYDMANEMPPFAKSLNRLLWDKIHAAVELAEDRCRIQSQNRTS